jgi:HAE1 family hydrophobic/amphiphilic exporter-1
MLVAAMVPMALGRGPGAGSRSSMAKVILGGQALSLLLTLLVTPVAYSLFEDIARLLRWRRVARGSRLLALRLAGANGARANGSVRESATDVTTRAARPAPGVPPGEG